MAKNLSSTIIEVENCVFVHLSIYRGRCAIAGIYTSQEKAEFIPNNSVTGEDNIIIKVPLDTYLSDIVEIYKNATTDKTDKFLKNDKENFNYFIRNYKKDKYDKSSRIKLDRVVTVY